MLSDEESQIVDDAVSHAKKIRNIYAKEFTCLRRFPKSISPNSVFMAGSPGAGKTEVSKELTRELSSVFKTEFIRIDPDEFRELFPQYNGGNSHLFQKAVVKVLEKVFDLVITQCQDFILDGTLSSFAVADKNIQRCLSKDRSVDVFFVYQDPLVSWKFVLAREEIEGRRILPEVFVDQFFRSRDCVNALKMQHGENIQLHCIVKNYDQSIGDCSFNVMCIDEKLFDAYNPRDLLSAITAM